MAERICSFEGCPRKVIARGWCPKHYAHWRKHGGPSIGPPPKKCSIEGCESPVHGRGWCQKHHHRFLRHGDPYRTDKPTGRPVASDPTYATVHGRLRRERGRASDHLCFECGAPAKQWSYDHSDDDQLFDDRGMPYSLDLSKYRPMCVSCHCISDKRRHRMG